MRRLALAAPFILLAQGDARADMSATAIYDEATLLRGFALAQCLGRVLPSIRADANAAAGGYVQQGSAAFEAYAEIDSLAAEFAKRDYAGKTGSDLSIMKCFDLLNSAELAGIIVRHRAGRR